MVDRNYRRPKKAIGYAYVDDDESGEEDSYYGECVVFIEDPAKKHPFKLVNVKAAKISALMAEAFTDVRRLRTKQVNVNGDIIPCKLYTKVAKGPYWA